MLEGLGFKGGLGFRALHPKPNTRTKLQEPGRLKVGSRWRTQSKVSGFRI